MVTKNFLRNFSVTGRELWAEAHDRDKRADVSREREASGEKERSKSRPKNRSTTPKSRRGGEVADDNRRRPKTPSKPRDANTPSRRNGHETDPASVARNLAEPRTPSQAALRELGNTTPKNVTASSRGALSDEKAYRKRNASSSSCKGLPELALGGTPTTPGGKSRQPHQLGASPATPKPPRGTSRGLPLFSIDRLKEGLSVPAKAHGCYEEAFGTDALSQTSSDAEGMLKLLGSEVSLREEGADLRRQLQVSELARAEADAAKDAAVSMVAEAELAKDVAEVGKLKAEAALAEAEEFRQAAELALEEAMLSFQEREEILQETVNSTLDKFETVVLEKAELEERLAEREQQIRSSTFEMETLKRHAAATEAALSEALGLLGSLEKKVKEDADSAGKKLGEMRRRVTMARVKSQSLAQVEEKEEADTSSAQLLDSEGSDQNKSSDESNSAVSQAAQELRKGYKQLTVSLSGSLRWNSRRSDPVHSEVDQMDEIVPDSARSRRKTDIEDEVMKSLKLQAGRIEQLVHEKMQIEVKMEAVVVEALSWADQNELLEEKLSQETQKWSAERVFLQTQLAAEDKELHSLEQEVLNLKHQITELQSEKEAVVAELSEAHRERTSASAQVLAIRDEEAQRWVEEKASFEAMVEAKNQEMVGLEQKLADCAQMFAGLEARMQQEAKEWYSERSSLEAQLAAKNSELLYSDDRVVTLQQQLLDLGGHKTQKWEEEKAALETQLQEMSEELQASGEMVAKLEEQVKQLQWERAASDPQSKATIAALEDKRDALAAAVPAQDLLNWAEEKSALEAQLMAKSKELSGLNEKLASVEERLTAAQREKTAVEMELQVAIGSLDVAKVEGTSKSKSKEVDELSQKVSGLKEQPCRMQEETSDHSPKAADADAASCVGAVVEEIEGEESQGHQVLQAERASLQAEVEEKRKKIESLEAEVDRLSRHISSLQNQKDGAEAELAAALAAKATDASADARDLREEIKALEKEKGSMLCELKAVQDRFTQETQKWEAERVSLEAGVEAKNREVMGLGQKVLDLELLVMHVQQEKGEFQARLLKASAALEAQLEEKDRELAEADTRLEDLNQQIVRMQEERGAAEAELRATITHLQEEAGAAGKETEGGRDRDGEGEGTPQDWEGERAFLLMQLDAKNKEVEGLDQKVIGLKREIFQLQEDKATSAEETAYMLSKFKADVETFDSQRAAWEDERWALQFLRTSAEEVRSEHEGVTRAMKWVEQLQAKVEQCQQERGHLNEEVAMLQDMMREKAQAYQVERETWHDQVASLEARLGAMSQESRSQSGSPLPHKSWGLDLSPCKEMCFKEMLLQELGGDARSSPSKSESSGDESTEEGVRLMSTDSGRSDGTQEEASLVVDLHRQLLELQAKYAKLKESKTAQEQACALGT